MVITMLLLAATLFLLATVKNSSDVVENMIQDRWTSVPEDEVLRRITSREDGAGL